MVEITLQSVVMFSVHPTGLAYILQVFEIWPEIADPTSLLKVRTFLLRFLVTLKENQFLGSVLMYQIIRPTFRLLV